MKYALLCVFAGLLSACDLFEVDGWHEFSQGEDIELVACGFKPAQIDQISAGSDEFNDGSSSSRINFQKEVQCTADYGAVHKEDGVRYVFRIYEACSTLECQDLWQEEHVEKGHAGMYDGEDIFIFGNGFCPGPQFMCTWMMKNTFLHELIHATGAGEDEHLPEGVDGVFGSPSTSWSITGNDWAVVDRHLGL